MVSFIKLNTWIGGQRSPWTMAGGAKKVKCDVLGYHIWSEEPLMQAKNNHDLCGGQRLTEVKHSRICSMIPNMVRRIAVASSGG